jgi:hypothetical protein
MPPQRVMPYGPPTAQKDGYSAEASKEHRGRDGRGVTTEPVILDHSGLGEARLTRSLAVHQPRTAEYHLRKVFSKLCVSSRRQLRHHLALA